MVEHTDRPDCDEPASEPPKRRWLQFSLRTILVLVAVAAGLLWGWRVYVQPYQQQRPVMDLVRDLGGRYTSEAGGLTWLHDLFGAHHFQDITLVDLADCDKPDAYVERLLTLPRLQTLVVGGEGFTDEHLARLRRIATLRWLVLDSTEVSNREIRSLEIALPNVVVHRSQRRAIAAAEEGSDRVKRHVVQTLPQLRQRVGDEHFIVATRLYYLNHKVDDNTLRPCRFLKDLDTLGVMVPPGSNKMSDAALLHLHRLTKLKRLSLSGTPRITDAGMQHLARLRQLEQLNLHGCGITEAGLAQLNCGATLKYLSIQDSDTAGLKQLASLFRNLQSLRLDGTSISDAELVHLRHLPNLQSLRLHRVALSDGGLQHLSHLSKLQNLGLDSNRITDAGLEHLKGLNRLQSLSLYRAKVSAAGLRHLRELLELKYLVLANMPLDDTGLASVGGCKGLWTLFLNKTKISDAGLAHLGQMTKLAALNLQDTDVGNEGMHHVCRLKSLRFLDLYGTRITDAGLQLLRSLPNLQEVSVGGTKVTNAGKAAFRKARPKVLVH